MRRVLSSCSWSLEAVKHGHTISAVGVEPCTGRLYFSGGVGGPASWGVCTVFEPGGCQSNTVFCPAANVSVDSVKVSVIACEGPMSSGALWLLLSHARAAPQ